jgi:acetyl esterase/lipase
MYPSGGGLAAVVSMRAATLTPPIPLLAQVLICPVLDNIATADSPTSRWYSNRHAPFLTPSRMLNYRNMYLPNQADRANWDASPVLAPKELLKGSPKTWLAIAGCDLLAKEAEDFGGMLGQVGVKVEVRVYEGCTHSILMLPG